MTPDEKLEYVKSEMQKQLLERAKQKAMTITGSYMLSGGSGGTQASVANGFSGASNTTVTTASTGQVGNIWSTFTPTPTTPKWRMVLGLERDSDKYITKSYQSMDRDEAKENFRKEYWSKEFMAIFIIDAE